MLVVRAHTLWDMENTAAAAELAFEAARRAPELPAARAMRGLTQLDAGDLGAAWDEAEYAQRRAPDEPLTYSCCPNSRENTGSSRMRSPCPRRPSTAVRSTPTCGSPGPGG